MRLLAGGIILYVLIFSGISVWKYDSLRYNARDLAIYNQVVGQLSYGTRHTERGAFVEKFYSSIQGHNYLGDHFEPILLLLAPFYAIVPDPRTLLMLQTLALAFAAIPLYLITENLLSCHLGFDPKSGKNKKQTVSNRFLFSCLDSRLRGNDEVNWLPTLVGLLWLLHPAVQNANLFEFHSLAFAPLFFFFLFWAYLKVRVAPMPDRRKACPYIFFILFLLLSLSVREDVALVIFVLGSLMFWKGLKQYSLIPLSIVTLIVSAGWFIAAQRIIVYFSPSHEYQYGIYYAWMGQFDSTAAAIRSIAAHIVTIKNLEMSIGFLLPLLFIPLIKSRWLLLAAPPLFAIILSQSGGGALIWQTHYGLLMLPGIFIGGAVAMKKLAVSYGRMMRAGVVTAAIGTMVAFGPLPYAVRTMIALNTIDAATRDLVKSIPPSASVAATDRFLAPLSSSRDIILLPLMLMGVQQYGAASYSHNGYPDYILLDERDMEADLIQARTLAWTSPFAHAMVPRFREMMDEGDYRIAARTPEAVLLTRDTTATKIPLFTFEEREYEAKRGGFTLDRLGSVQLIID